MPAFPPLLDVVTGRSKSFLDCTSWLSWTPSLRLPPLMLRLLGWIASYYFPRCPQLLIFPPWPAAPCRCAKYVHVPCSSRKCSSCNQPLGELWGLILLPVDCNCSKSPSSLSLSRCGCSGCSGPPAYTYLTLGCRNCCRSSIVVTLLSIPHSWMPRIPAA